MSISQGYKLTAFKSLRSFGLLRRQLGEHFIKHFRFGKVDLLPALPIFSKLFGYAGVDCCSWESGE